MRKIRRDSFGDGILVSEVAEKVSCGFDLFLRWFACSGIRAVPHHTWLMARVLCSQSVSVSRLERNERRELIREKGRGREMRGQVRVRGGSVCSCYVDLSLART